MKRHVLALLLALLMVLGLFGCDGKPAETLPGETAVATESTAAPTETTAPTEPDPAEVYAQARQAIDDAQNLEFNVTISEKRSVGGDTYTESTNQTIALQGMGTESLTASLSETITTGEYVYSSKEYFSEGTAYLMFDNLPFSSPITQEDYLSRLVPAVLIDETLYEEITLQAGISGNVLIFSQPTAGESWAVPENAELLSAQGNASIDENGILTKTSYTVSYRYGSTQYDISVSTTISLPDALNITNTLPASMDEYVELEYVDAPYLLLRAIYDMHQADNLTGRTIDTMITYAGGAIFSQQENIDLYGVSETTMSNYTVDISMTGASGPIYEYELTENIQNSILNYSEDGSDPLSRKLTGSVVAQCRDDYLDLLLTFMWTPDDLASATITDLGSVYYLEMSGNDALGEACCGDACYTFWQDENFLNDLASNYTTSELTAYLSIDKYTQLPVAFGYTYEGVHTIDGGEYALSDQWDQTMFLSSNTAYETITEEPLPDVEPAEKATPLFYHVTGENGQEMWLFGTIHVGDDRTAFLPQEIYDALESSDALAIECDVEAFDEQLEEDDSLMAQVQKAYFYPDGSMTKDHISEENYEIAVKLLKATGNYYMNAEYLKPYFWAQSIENFCLQQGYALVSEKGVESRLLDRARSAEIKIYEVESSLFQLNMMGSYSEDLQELLLEDALYIDSAEYCASVAELYDLWCEGNEEAMRKELSSTVDTSEFTEEELAEYESQKHLIDEYNKAMSYDRNDGMLDVAIRYLESGETVFYAVGLAHLMDDVNGLVDTLREAGYTVELVTYTK